MSLPGIGELLILTVMVAAPVLAAVLVAVALRRGRSRE